jgi:hypothetical protein
VAKQEVEVELFYDGQWNAAPVYTRDAIEITRGRGDGAQQASPAQATLTLDNREDDLYNPRNPSGPLYGLVGRNTPLRVTLDGTDVRFHGEVSSWKPRRSVEFDADTDRGDAWTEVTASGVLRRLGQGDDPLHSALRQHIPTTDPVAYWPLEDGADSTLAASGLDGGSPMQVSVGQIHFTPDGPAGSAGAAEPELHAQSTLSAPVSGGSSSVWQWGVWVRGTVQDPDSTAYVIIAQLETDSALWQIFLQHTGAYVSINTFGSGAGSTSISQNTYPVLDGRWHLVQLSVEQDGADINAYLNVDNQELNSAIMSSRLIGTPRRIRATGRFEGTGFTAVSENMASAAVAHITLHNELSLNQMYDVGAGYIGEAAGRRIERLCDEQGVPFTSSGDLDATTPMGPQRPDTFLALLAECERTDDGLLTEPRDSIGLHYRTRVDLYNQAPTLELDFAASEIAPTLEPVVDDLDVFNDVTAQRRDGSTARAVRETGPLNVQSPTDDPEGIGRYATQITVNPQSDANLTDQAGWQLHKGTVDETRYPRLTVDLDASPGLTADAAAVVEGDVITIANLQADTPSLMVAGSSETIGSHRRTITFNCVPAAPYTLPEWGSGSDPNGTGPDRYSPVEGGTATAASFVSGTGTSLSVATTVGPLWTTDADDLPFDIAVAGVRLTVTAISGATSPQTFTVTQAPVNGVTKTIPSGSTVRLWQPAIRGL